MRLSGSHQTPELINISNGMVQRNGSFSWSNIQQLLENKLCQRISSSVRTLYMCLFIYPCGLHVFPARLLIHDLSLGPRSNITHFIHPLWIMAHQEGYKCFTKNTTDWLLMLMPFARHCGMVYWWVTNTDTSLTEGSQRRLIKYGVILLCRLISGSSQDYTCSPGKEENNMGLFSWSNFLCSVLGNILSFPALKL